METRSCKECGANFTLYDEDLRFYKLFEVPPSTRCPTCRLIRRFLERNTKHLSYRTCDFTGERTLSQYHQDQPFPVYAPSAWWSNKWDATSYGQPFDFARPFFEQFRELKWRVPHCALFNTEGTMENSDFNNCTAYIKNCYLIAESDFCEDCYYSNLLKNCRNVVDCSICYETELCYECIDCRKCFWLQYSQDCLECRDSFFLKNCIACSDCIGCMNQRHKKYMIFNIQYSREEYEKQKQKFELPTQGGISKLREQCEKFFLAQPQKAVIAEHNENSIGDHLYDSKNAFHCFDSKDLEDCRYCAKLSLGVKLSMDYNSWGNKSQLMYQCTSCGDHNYNLRFCVMCQKDMRDCDYCYECFSSTDCFGCVGLQRKKYCILNKQYSKEEYFELKKRIIAHMQETSEWGEFFPPEIGAFAYNESIAMDIFPFTREQALAKGYRWREEVEKTYQPHTVVVSDDLKILACERCKRNYKIIAQELAFYKRLDVPIPLYCPDCRHKMRQAKRNPLMLFPRTCSKCNSECLTSYRPESKEMVYCEACYLKEVY